MPSLRRAYFRRMDVYPDPKSPLAITAAENVRSMFTARIGEQADSHQQWNDESTTTIQSLTDGIVDRLNGDDARGAVEFAGLWAATYLGAFGLLADRLLQHAIVRAYIHGGGDPEDQAGALAFLVSWREPIVSEVFTMLVDEGKTIV